MSFNDDSPRENYSPIQVHSMSDLIERLGADCLPDQACREFTQNAIQSIEQRQKKEADFTEGLVLWSSWMWPIEKVPSIPKLALIDTGGSMTGDQMRMYINRLMNSAPGGTTSKFGIGARITGLIRSSRGILYACWIAGKGEMGLLKKTDDDNYGLVRDRKGRDTYPTGKFIEMPSEIKTIGRGTGTMVIFLGKEISQPTLNLFGDNATSVIRYLNDRYYSFPKGITVRSKIHDDDYGGRIHGTRFMLDQAYIAKGSVTLPDTGAIARWWVLGDPKGETPNPYKEGEEGSFKQMKSFSKYFRVSGHTAYLYENELYEYEYGNASTARVQRCGIPLNTSRVVIYFEPTDSRIGSNSARSKLQLNLSSGTGEPLVWDYFAEEFRRRMPQELRDTMASLDHGQNYNSRDEAVSKRLRESVGLFAPLGKVVRAAYKDAAGTPIVNPNKKLGEMGFSDTGRQGPNREKPRPPEPGTRPTRPRPDRKGDYTRELFELSDEDDAELGFAVNVGEIKEPDVSWVSRFEKFKQPCDNEREDHQLVDRAASYDPTNHMLVINRDFSPYQAWIEMYAQQYPNTAQARDVIRGVLDTWWLLALKECVMLYEVHKSLNGWNPPSPEILTAVVLARYTLRHHLTRDIHTKLGKPEHSLNEAAAMDLTINRESEGTRPAQP